MPSSALVFFWLAHKMDALGPALATNGLLWSIVTLRRQLAFPVIPIAAAVFVASVWILYLSERRIAMVRGQRLGIYGGDCVWLGLAVTMATGSGSALLTLLTPGLLNVWDQVFVWIVMGVQYIGIFLYLYYSVPLTEWVSKDGATRLKQLELIWDQQRMFLKAFSYILVSVLVGQVFAVMQVRYRDIWDSPARWAEQSPRILLNASQLGFLVLGWWGLVFARVLRRMEQVLLLMRDVKGSA